jgi:hypothetical protein
VIKEVVSHVEVLWKGDAHTSGLITPKVFANASPGLLRNPGKRGMFFSNNSEVVARDCA